MPRTVKVAVIGSGLAGLTAAHLLTRPCEGDVEFEVHVFEKSSLIGMDSSSISLGTPDSPDKWRIDVPMRSFQGGYYTQLIELYKSIGVNFRQADFSYSFSSLLPARKAQVQSITTTFIYNGSSGRAGLSKPSAFGRSSKEAEPLTNAFQNLWTRCLFLAVTFQQIICFFLTVFYSLPICRSKSLEDVIFRDWVLQVAPRGILARLTGMDTAWDDYVQFVLVPIFSAVCTSPAADVMNHPVEELLDYIWLTFGTHHYVVLDGVRNVVARLTSGLANIHLSSPITSIQPDNHKSKTLSISCLSNDRVEEYSGFHHIIFATQASGAVPILSTYLESLPEGLRHRKETTTKLLRTLRAFQYRPSIVINHTDGSLLPDDDSDVRELNLISLAPYANADTPLESKGISSLQIAPSYTMATHILRRPKGYPSNQPTVYQTTNPIIPPQKESVLSVATLERAVVTMGGKKALASLCLQDSRKWWQVPYQAKTRLGKLQGGRTAAEPYAPGIWICGSYAHLGIPLLEGCVISARNVVEQGILESEGTRWKEQPWITGYWTGLYCTAP